MKLSMLPIFLLSVSCSDGHDAHGEASPTPAPYAQSPTEHDAHGAPRVKHKQTIVDLSSYHCICNRQDVGTCQTIFVRQSEVSWYVHFTFQGVTILKRATECKPILRWSQK